jgi:uncharacterized protein (AIM24 family)
MNKKPRIIPNYEVIHKTTFPYVKIDFKHPDEELIARPGSFFMKTDSVTFRSRMVSGFTAAMGRLLSDEDFFMNVYSLKENREEPGYVLLSNNVPGEITEITILPGETYYITPSNFLACSRNLKLSGKLKFAQAISDVKGLTILSIRNLSDDNGKIFLHSFGSSEKFIIKQGETIQIDNSHILFFDKKADISVSKISNTKGFILGGEGLTLAITPKEGNEKCEIVVQTNSFPKYVRKICRYCSRAKINIKVSSSGSNTSS